MVWIDTKMSLPSIKGKYTCLVAVDDFGTLQQVELEHFDGQDWSHTHSHRQFIRYWQARKDQYQDIHSKLEDEKDSYDLNNWYENNFGEL